MRRSSRVLFVLLLAASGLGCGGEEEPTTAVRGSGRPLPKTGPAKPPKGAPPAAAPGQPTTAGPAADLGPFVYKPGRDPFQSYFDITGEAQEVTQLDPLQKHELSKLKVIAIVTGTVQPAAMVVDPGGKPFLVKRGTLIGPPRGRVARILSDRIVVEREYKDRLERIHKLVHELRIRQEEEEKEARQ